MPRSLHILSVAAFMLIACLAPLSAQEKEVRFNSNLPGEISQFEFLLGEWDAQYTTELSDGSKNQLKVIWEIKLILDNSAYQDNWEIFDMRGQSLGHGTMFRAYSQKNKQWEIVEITSWKPEYHHMTARKEGENMVMYEEQERNGKKIKARRVFSDIRRDSFRWDYEEWDDAVKKWSTVSHMDVKRIKK
jgi:hypothetical protein